MASLPQFTKVMEEFEESFVHKVKRLASKMVVSAAASIAVRAAHDRGDDGGGGGIIGPMVSRLISRRASVQRGGGAFDSGAMVVRGPSTGFRPTEADRALSRALRTASVASTHARVGSAVAGSPMPTSAAASPGGILFSLAGLPAMGGTPTKSGAGQRLRLASGLPQPESDLVASAPLPRLALGSEITAAGSPARRGSLDPRGSDGPPARRSSLDPRGSDGHVAPKSAWAHQSILEARGSTDQQIRTR